MATVKNTILLNDRFTPTLRSVIKALDSTVVALSSVDKISESAFNQMKRDVQRATDSVEQFNNELKGAEQQVQRTAKGSSNIGANLAGAIYSAQALVGLFSRAANYMDKINAQKARANMVSQVFGGTTSGTDIQAAVMQAANNARGNYSTMMDATGKMGIMAKDAFKNPQELVDFNEQLQKLFVIAGTGGAQIDSAMLQLTQSMASGVLRGEEFNAVFEAAPNIIQKVAEYTGMSTGQMRKLSQEGKLTAEVVKYALLSTAEETNKAFEGMPMSFQAVSNKIQNEITQRLQPAAEQMGYVWGWVIDNWNTVLPVVSVLAGALGGLVLVLGLVALAQWAVNVAQYASPMVWMSVIIFIVVTALAMLVVWLLIMWRTNTSFKYGILNDWAAILRFFASVPIFFQAVGYGIANAFDSARVKVMQIIDAMVNGVIGAINYLITEVNKIPGVAIPTINQVNFAAATKAEQLANSKKREAELNNAKFAVDASYADNLAVNAANKEKDDAKLAADKAKLAALKNASSSIPDYTTLKGGTVDKVGKIDSPVDITDEDIKMLKDIAAVELVNKYTTLRPEMKVTFGDVHETADVKEILTTIETMVEDAYASSLVT